MCVEPCGPLGRIEEAKQLYVNKIISEDSDDGDVSENVIKIKYEEESGVNLLTETIESEILKLEETDSKDEVDTNLLQSSCTGI